MSRHGRRRTQDDDQRHSAADQTVADADQTASDTDQTASDRDQAQSEADQRASDRDQAASDRDLSSHPEGGDERQKIHGLSRTERAEGSLDRHATTRVRAQVSVE